MAAAPSSTTSGTQAPPKDGVFIELRDVHKRFGSQEILRGIDLQLKHGETLCVIGPSGEGKTVMMKHIIGLIRPDQGDVFVEGMNVNLLNERQMAPIREKVSMLFQGAALFDRMTVEENVAFPLWESGLRDRVEIKRRVTEALEAVDLAEHLHKYPTSLSGGMRKRTGIARAIITRSECILYDEPNSGLDPIGSDIIDQMILRMQRRYGVTSIIVTHDMRSIFKIADRVAMLYRGKIHFLGTPEELRNSPDPEVQNFINGRSDVTG
ncbi:MAG: ABC transporter ATP-binding protein [Prosthecobacter sp.]|jgi:phospholipid/cholesterol/gamma-HCH transport system ATP-binding protein|uniref:ABC transporter ATP-binding protein n=1 Tax=Prosthecobacter sp. TaxID=1965333 RepID=UPI0019EB4A5C|nr:ABC transporter ATP-binding protein [Prosthecobacter sp.]MBE2285225.1 ABC transporter ATP-binding protein [Prosthecobacter sp.]